jgi:fibronectin type 3 domain-containing protein
METIKSILFGLLVVIAAGIIACGGVSSSGGGGDEPPNYVPQNVTAEAGYETITIRWDNVSGAQYYNIYWGLDNTVSKTTGTQIYNELSPYEHENLDKTTEYFYVVTAITGDGESDESNVVSATPSVLNPPPPPPGP